MLPHFRLNNFRNRHATRRWLMICFVFFGSMLMFSCFLLIERLESKRWNRSSELLDHFNQVMPSVSSNYEQIVILSCSSYSFSWTYCYYLPFVALAWRRLGFEPVVFLLGSKKMFEQSSLLSLLENYLDIRYIFFETDAARSISASQLIRLFGGFLHYEKRSEKDLFIFVADVDLVPISRHRFTIFNPNPNSILVINAFCCPKQRFDHLSYKKISYYPISYVGMTQKLWRQIFYPLNRCSLSLNLTLDLIECCLEAQFNTSIERNVRKGGRNWDLDQRLLSILIAQAQQIFQTTIDKRPLGSRLDPNPNIVPSDYRHVLAYDDLHLPNSADEIIFMDRTWSLLKKAFSNLFSDSLLILLTHHYRQSSAFVQSRKQHKWK